MKTITWAVKSLAPTVGGVGGDISALDILYRDFLDVEFDIVSGDSFRRHFVVRFRYISFRSGRDNFVIFVQSEGVVHPGGCVSILD